MSAAESWLVVTSGRCRFDFNMALDEALLEAMPRLNRPVLRFYGWTEPAASFGYFQHYADVERWTTLRPLVRRPTGGGIVPHDRDWTYSLAVPVSHPWYALTAVESYRRIHAWVQSAFARLKLDVELAPAAKPAQPGQCFAGWERFDLLWRGRKIAGAAQRRRKDGLLIQGSVQPPPGPKDRCAWETAMLEVGKQGSAIDWTTFEPDALLQKRAEALAGQKYSRAEYTVKR